MKCIEDEIPFEVPEGWGWARLQTICSLLTDGTHKTPTYSDIGYAFLSSKNVTKGVIDWDNIMYIPEYLHIELHERLAPQLNDILLAKNGTTGKAALVDRECLFDIYVSLALIRIVKGMVFPQYALNAIGSTYIQDYFDHSLKGIGVPNLHLEHIRKTLIPIPPYQEQLRIIEKTNQIIPLCNQIQHNKENISRMATIVKSKILDLAIRGKLVPQDPNDEPASILLERIRSEKEELIKQGEIKRDKKESVIFKGDDNSYYEKFSDGTIINIQSELPFDIPDSWRWEKLSLLTTKEIKRGKMPKYDEKGTVLVFAQKCNLKNGNIDFGLSQFLNKDILYKYDKSEYLYKEDIVINSTGTGTLGRVGYIDIDPVFPIVPDSHVTTIRVNTCIKSNYIYAFLKSLQPQLEESGEGSTNQKELKPNTLQNLFVPVPPIKEQIRICEYLSQTERDIKNIESNLA